MGKKMNQERNDKDDIGYKIINNIKEGHKKTIHAWKTITFTHLIWLFFIGSMVGYLVETVYAYMNYGFIISRQGMLYGPFSQIYGLAAIILLIILLPLLERGKVWLFIGSGIIGGLFEAVCSFIQEKVFGTVSWIYTEEMIPIFGGRSSLLYMLYWSILGYVYIQFIYPRLMDLVDRIPAKALKISTTVITIFLMINLTLSGIAVYRWAERMRGETPDNIIEIWVDRYYPDEKMFKIYPNMHFPHNDMKTESIDDIINRNDY